MEITKKIFTSSNSIIEGSPEAMITQHLDQSSMTDLPIDLLGVLPEIFLFVVISTLLIVGSSYSTSASNNYPIMVSPIAWLALYSLLLTFLLNINNC